MGRTADIQLNCGDMLCLWKSLDSCPWFGWDVHVHPVPCLVWCVSWRFNLSCAISSLWRGTFLIGTLLEHSFLLILIRHISISVQIYNAISFQKILFRSCFLKVFSNDDFTICCMFCLFFSSFFDFIGCSSDYFVFVFIFFNVFLVFIIFVF